MLTLGEVLGILKYPRRITCAQQALRAQLCEFQLRLNNPFDVCQLQGIALVGVRSLNFSPVDRFSRYVVPEFSECATTRARTTSPVWKFVLL